MPTFNAGQIVRVPFPYSDRDTRQFRPALVVSSRDLGSEGLLCWVVMIASAENRPWPGDVSLVEDDRQVGLPAPSVIRTSKIATVEIRRLDAIGRVSDAVMDDVRRELSSILNR